MRRHHTFHLGIPVLQGIPDSNPGIAMIMMIKFVVFVIAAAVLLILGTKNFVFEHLYLH